MYSEIVYFSSILTCISLGSHYKNIDDKDLKRNYGTGLGLLIVFLLCGKYIYHSAFMTWGNVIIIKCCDKRYLHQISLVYTWMYLIYLSYNIENSYYILCIHQAIALRLVGLAFEINETYKQYKQKSDSGLSLPMKINVYDENNTLEDINVIDIVAYAYCFIGLHKGPYYRWQTFNDQFNTPFGNLGDCRSITEVKLKRAAICAVVYMFLRAKFPTEVYNQDNFYTGYGADMRYLYNIPQLLMYILQYQLVLMLCTAVCTEAGFGVYPVQCQALPGHGPSMKFSVLKLAATKPKLALEQEYNFSMLKSFENEQLLLGPRMRDTLRAWDMSTRYWFWTNIYKRIDKTKEEIRSLLSFLAWSIWCGPSIQQLIISSTLWIHIQLEKEYSDLYDTTDSMKSSWDIGFSIMRVLCWIYLTPCLILHDSSAVLRYYNCMFWVYHIVLLVVLAYAVVAHKICHMDCQLHIQRVRKNAVPNTVSGSGSIADSIAGPSTSARII